ncbi:Rrf2 family transcriptional regulator [candidate division KSB1 bacterium]|nr:Rrf2 family transcriptional regulator [candidate division KSB1 bacterium]
MKITYKGDYALKAILDLAFQFESGKAVPLSEISQRQNIPENYLEQIMLILKRAGLITSKRGVGGGFVLLHDPAKLTLGEVIRLVEGPIEPILCGKIPHTGSCGEEATCAFREIWVKVTNAISDVVDQVTFAYIMQRTNVLNA